MHGTKLQWSSTKTWLYLKSHKIIHCWWNLFKFSPEWVALDRLWSMQRGGSYAVCSWLAAVNFPSASAAIQSIRSYRSSMRFRLTRKQRQYPRRHPHRPSGRLRQWYQEDLVSLFEKYLWITTRISGTSTSRRKRSLMLRKRERKIRQIDKVIVNIFK